MPRPPLDDVEFNHKLRKHVEDMITAWEDELEEEAKQAALNHPSEYNALDIAVSALDDLEVLAKLLGRGSWSGERDEDGNMIEDSNGDGEKGGADQAPGVVETPSVDQAAVLEKGT